MKKRLYIQKCIGAFLFLVFLVCSAPKEFFHELVADHTDLPSCVEDHHSTVLHKENHDCHFDELVVSFPFVLNPSQYSLVAAIAEPASTANFTTSSFREMVQNKESRGPPVC